MAWFAQCTNICGLQEHKQTGCWHLKKQPLDYWAAASDCTLLLHWSWDLNGLLLLVGHTKTNVCAHLQQKEAVHNSPSVLLMSCHAELGYWGLLVEMQKQWNKLWIMEHSRLQSQAVTSSAISWCSTVWEQAWSRWKTLITQTCPLALLTLQGRQNLNLRCFFLLQFFNELSRLEIIAFQFNTVSSIFWCYCHVSKSVLNTSDHLKKNYFGAAVVKLLKMPA